MQQNKSLIGKQFRGTSIALAASALLALSGCSSSGSSDSGGGDSGGGDSGGGVTETTYKLTVADDMVLNADVEAIGCEKGLEVGNGEYTLKCATKPKVIVASGGYYMLDGIKHSIDLPLMLNTQLLKDGKPFVVTPATTMIASLTTKEEIEAFAASLGLNLDTIYALPSTESQDIFRYLNLINTLAIESGVKDEENFLNYVREKIKTKGNAANSTVALANIKTAINDLKDDPNIIKAFSFGFDGFINEFKDIDPTALAAEMQKYVPGSDEVVFTGFIYDKIIPGATVVATIAGTVVGTTTADAYGKWRMKIKSSNITSSSLIIFTATVELDNSLSDTTKDKIEFKTMVTGSEVAAAKGSKLNAKDDINLVISNVTTAEYVLVEQQLQEPDSTKWTSTQVTAAKETVKTDSAALLLDLSAAIKVVVDTDVTIPDNTLIFAKNILPTATTPAALNLQTNYSTQQPAITAALPSQSILINDDPILSQQLVTQTTKPSLSDSFDIKALFVQGTQWITSDGGGGEVLNNLPLKDEGGVMKNIVREFFYPAMNKWVVYPSDNNSTAIYYINGSWESITRDMSIYYANDLSEANFYDSSLKITAVNDVAGKSFTLATPYTTFGTTSKSVTGQSGSVVYDILMENKEIRYRSFGGSGASFASIQDYYDSKYNQTSGFTSITDSRYGSTRLVFEGSGVVAEYSNDGNTRIKTLGEYVLVETPNDPYAPDYIEVVFHDTADEFRYQDGVTPTKIIMIENNGFIQNGQKEITYSSTIQLYNAEALASIDDAIIDPNLPAARGAITHSSSNFNVEFANSFANSLSNGVIIQARTASTVIDVSGAGSFEFSLNTYATVGAFNTALKNATTLYVDSSQIAGAEFFLTEGNGTPITFGSGSLKLTWLNDRNKFTIEQNGASLTASDGNPITFTKIIVVSGY